MNIPLNTNMINNGFKVQRRRFGVGSLLILAAFGVTFAGVGLSLIFSSSEVDDNWRRVEGTVVDASSYISDGATMRTPIVSYTVDGQVHRITSSFSSSSFPKIGEIKEVAYNPTRPEEAKVIENLATTWWLWLFPLIGVGMIIAATISSVRSLKRSKDIKILIQTGHKLQGVLVDVLSSGGSKGASSKIIVAATDTSGAVKNYESDELNSIGALAMADFRNTPIPIDVYIDPIHSHKYYVDISDIPSLTPDRIAQLLKSVAKSQQFQSIANARQTQPPSNDDSLSPTKNT